MQYQLAIHFTLYHQMFRSNGGIGFNSFGSTQKVVGTPHVVFIFIFA